MDVERGRTVKGWKPRRFGGGLGGRGYTKAMPVRPTGPGGFNAPSGPGGYGGGFRGGFGGREASVVDSAVTVGLVGREPALDTKAAVMDLVLNLRQMHRLALGVAELVGMSEVLIQIDVEAAGLSGMQEVPQAATVNR